MRWWQKLAWQSGAAILFAKLKHKWKSQPEGSDWGQELVKSVMSNRDDSSKLIVNSIPALAIWQSSQNVVWLSFLWMYSSHLRGFGSTKGTMPLAIVSPHANCAQGTDLCMVAWPNRSNLSTFDHSCKSLIHKQINNGNTTEAKD